MTSTRLAALGHEEPPLLSLAQRLLSVAELGLPEMLLPGGEAFSFTMSGRKASDGSWTLDRRGTSTRYAAITALGVEFLPEDRQRAVLAGRTAQEFTGLLIESLPAVTNLGDAALIAWAAAETGHPKLSDALARVEALDEEGRPSTPSRWHGCCPRSRPLATRSTWRDVSPRPATVCCGPASATARCSRTPPAPAWCPGTGHMWPASPTRHTRCRPWPAPTPATTRAATRRHWPRPRRARSASASCRATAGSGGGTTTRAPALSWRATRSTASTSTRWPRPPCSTSPTPAAATSARRSARACAGCRTYPNWAPAMSR